MKPMAYDEYRKWVRYWQVRDKRQVFLDDDLLRLLYDDGVHPRRAAAKCQPANKRPTPTAPDEPSARR